MIMRIPVVLAVLCAVAASVVAQAEPAKDEKRLVRLLEELRGLDAEVWTARRARLREQVAARRRNAADLRERAVDLIQRSEREEERADALERELRVQTDLMEVVARLPRKARPSAPPVADAMAKSDAAASAATAKTDPETTEVLYDFDTHVAPIFEASCTLCHEPGNAKGGLDLSTFEAMMRGGGSGDVIVPGDAEGSRLYRLTARLERPFMPRGGGTVPDEDLAILRAWILGGAPRSAVDAKRARESMKKDDAAGDEPRAESRGDGAMPETIPVRERTVTENPEPVTCVAASPRAPLLARPGLDEVVLFHSETTALLAVLPFDLGRVEALDFSADGERLLAAGGRAGASGGAIVWSVRTGKELFRLDRRGDAFLAGALAGDGSLVALGGANKRLLVHDVVEGTQLHRITGHDDWILSVDFSPDDSMVAGGDRKGRVLVTDVGSGSNLHVLDGHEGAVQSLEFSPDGRYLATAGDDGKLRLWDPADGELKARGDIHAGGAMAIAWTPDGKMASAGRNGRVKYWTSVGRRSIEIGNLGDFVYAIAVDHAGERVFAGGYDGRVRILLIDAGSKQ